MTEGIAYGSIVRRLISARVKLGREIVTTVVITSVAVTIVGTTAILILVGATTVVSVTTVL
jgi:hypothetical protein